MVNRVVTLELHSDYCGNCAVCAGRQVGVNDERERIIKLLEEEKAQYESIGGSIFYEVAAINKFIALIKGEK